ncbi:hypothetical protein [Prodigiosinella confusarubida]|uniref:hypothetical protein n=1 Tax=Serratia sp. (strain ATCC 39006) TaxID=104623 RepID=UPI0003921915|nr:hypothetical protein [Serratia sp. ATCC 39006]
MLIISMADTLGSAAYNVGFLILSKLLTPDTAAKTMGLLLAIWAVGNSLVPGLLVIGFVGAEEWALKTSSLLAWP